MTMKRLLLFLCVTLTSIACSKDDNNKEQFRLSETEFDVKSSGETIRVDITTNTTFDIEMPDVDWISLSTESTSTSKTKYFDIEANDTYEDRHADIVFVTSGKDRKPVRISQDKKLVVLTDAESEYRLGKEGGLVEFRVDYNMDYTVDITPESAKTWITQNTANTRALDHNNLSFTVDGNDTTDERDAKIVITSEDENYEPIEIPVFQEATIIFDVVYHVTNIFNAAGGTFNFDVMHNLDFDVTISDSAREWIHNVSQTSSDPDKTPMNFTIDENQGGEERSGSITLSTNKTDDIVISITQRGYTSSDYSQDGEVTILQEATEGNGIDLIFMGDGYTDKLIADGTYMNTMEKAVDNFFSIEPHKSFKRLYNIYIVTTVSERIVFGQGNSNSSKTALGGWFGSGTSIGARDQACIDYSLNAISADRMDNALVIAVLNKSGQRSGTCYMYNPANQSNISDNGVGFAIAYQSLSFSDYDFKGLIHHECGHGFAKLQDEYVYTQYIGQTVSAGDRNYWERQQQDTGWWKNVSFTNDRNQVSWAKFLDDPRYSTENLGVYEGARYGRGMYRSAIDGIMRSNFGRFNPPSREAIYYRIHKLAYVPSWTYDHETFVAYDSSVNFGIQSSASSTGEDMGIATYDFAPPTPPVVYPYSWREALNK